MSCYQHAGQNQNTVAVNKVSKNVAKFRYLVTALTTRRIHKQIKVGLNPGNRFSSTVQPENVEVTA
jgi:hypothetical protein